MIVFWSAIIGIVIMSLTAIFSIRLISKKE